LLQEKQHVVGALWMVTLWHRLASGTSESRHAQNISQTSKSKSRGNHFGVRMRNYQLNEVIASQQLDSISKGNTAEGESQMCCSVCCSFWRSFCTDRNYRLRQVFNTPFHKNVIWEVGRGNNASYMPKIMQLQHENLMFSDSSQKNPKESIVGLTTRGKYEK